jgi:hypothetical protein
MLTQLVDPRPSPDQPVGRVRGMAGAAWRCDDCQVWWGSQMDPKPTTSFLLRLPDDLAEILLWEAYRGWRETTDKQAMCPECDQPSGQIVHLVAWRGRVG